MENTMINVKEEPHLAGRTLALKVLSCSSHLAALELKLLLEGRCHCATESELVGYHKPGASSPGVV